MLYFSRNIQLLRKRKKRSQEELAGVIGIKRSTLSAYEVGTAEPNLDTLIRFSRFFKISVDKLLMLDLASISEFYLSELEKGFDTDITGKRIRVLATTVDRENEDNIEVVPIKAKAGYTAGYADPEFIRVLPTFQMPFLNKNRKYRTFQISGDSMPPVAHGSWVTGEYLENWQLLQNGKPYIIVTKDEGVVFKVVYNKLQENQSLMLCSTNPQYAPYEVHINDVLEIWKFVNYISEEMMDTQWQEEKLSQTILNIHKDLAEVKNKLNHLT